MPREEDSKQNAEEAAKAAAAKAAEEKQKHEDRAAVTKGLTDQTTMKQLSSSGYEAKAKRQR
ncbi:MAG: hypothetical protein LBE67_18815 [Kocuria palustris]|jgi:hypothetical protein|nr:hypothetical protein [Kocuria palustris]